MYIIGAQVLLIYILMSLMNVTVVRLRVPV